MTAPPVAPIRSAPLWLLTLITFSGTLAMHIFVPAMPEAGLALGANAGQMQMTMSVYILGLAMGQLLYGPLSDRFGRRPLLMIGLLVYTLTSVAAAFATAVNGLIALRLFQALGGCAGLVIGRAMVRDSVQSHEAARRLALMNFMVVFGPGAAPLIGSALASFLGWRSIFYALALLGIVNVICAWFLLPESRTPTVAPDGHSPRGSSLARDYARLLTSPTFLGYAIGGACATTAMYAFIGASPFIFAHQLHRPDYEIGLYPAILMGGVASGSMVATKLISRVRIERLAVWASLVSLLASLTFLAVVLTDNLSVALVIGPMFVFGFGAGIAAPAALTQAMSVNPNVVGSASGLYGFSQMGVGALCTTLVAAGDNPALAAAIILAAAGVIGQLSFI
jgi:MFS transporter, DHA1 family, multidrug resistance protein